MSAEEEGTDGAPAGRITGDTDMGVLPAELLAESRGFFSARSCAPTDGRRDSRLPRLRAEAAAATSGRRA